MNPCGNGGPRGPDSPMKISAKFICFYPLKKPNFYSIWHGSLSRWLPFEHSSIEMGSLDIDPVYSTLCPSIITSTHSTSKFHLNTFQFSVGGAAMFDTITYSKDCIIILLADPTSFAGSSNGAPTIKSLPVQSVPL